jgi:hypothetical protein
MSEPIRIAMWSGPRNISTAMMRSWESRGDCCVVDEPFYACYLEATGIDHPMREEVLASQPRNWRAVVEGLRAPLPEGVEIQYQKQMAHHMIVTPSEGWMRSVRHAFLIRDPREVVASYVEKRAAVTPDDLGFRRQMEIFDRVVALTGAEPPIIEGLDVLRDPGRALRVLCEALDVPFSERMLSWRPGLRETDGVWARHWYGAAARSTGFQAPASEGPVVELPSALRSVADACMPRYDYLRAMKIRV